MSAAKRRARCGPQNLKNLKYCMWMLNTYFFVIILAAMRTGELWTIVPVAAVFMLLLYWLEELEDYGTDYTVERPPSRDNHHSDRLLDDTLSDLDNSKTR